MTGQEIRTVLAGNIKTLRAQKGMSQEELSDKADISIPFLSSIERGVKWPYPDTLAKLADALEVEVAQLFAHDILFSGSDMQCAADIIHDILVSQQAALDSICRKYLPQNNER